MSSILNHKLFKNLYVKENNIAISLKIKNEQIVEDDIVDIIYHGTHLCESEDEDKVKIGTAFWGRSKNHEIYEIMYFFASEYKELRMLNFDEKVPTITTKTIGILTNIIKDENRDGANRFYMIGTDTKDNFYKLYLTEGQVKLIEFILTSVKNFGTVFQDGLRKYRYTYNTNKPIMVKADPTVKPEIISLSVTPFNGKKNHDIRLFIKYNQNIYLLLGVVVMNSKNFDKHIAKALKGTSIELLPQSKLMAQCVIKCNDKDGSHCIITSLKNYIDYNVENDKSKYIFLDLIDGAEYHFEQNEFDEIFTNFSSLIGMPIK